MKSIMLVSIAALVLTACATGPVLSDVQQADIYRANAGAPINSFKYPGSLYSFEPVGDSAMVAWTRPNDGYLLTFTSECSQLEYSRAISFSTQTGVVSAGLDSVIVLDQPINIPCRIKTIQPLDGEAVQRDKDMAEAALQTSGT